MGGGLGGRGAGAGVGAAGGFRVKAVQKDAMQNVEAGVEDLVEAQQQQGGHLMLDLVQCGQLRCCVRCFTVWCGTVWCSVVRCGAVS